MFGSTSEVLLFDIACTSHYCLMLVSHDIT